MLLIFFEALNGLFVSFGEAIGLSVFAVHSAMQRFCRGFCRAVLREFWDPWCAFGRANMCFILMLEAGNLPGPVIFQEQVKNYCEYSSHPYLGVSGSIPC